MNEEDNRRAIRPPTGGMLTVNLADEIARLKTGPEWQSQDRHARSLVKDEALNVLLMVLKKGAKLREHHTEGPIAVHLVSGSIRFTGGANHCLLSRDEIVALDRGIPHSLEALEDSSLVLTTAVR
jgi:quercetin dioxygenase-like cupin family protein